MRDNWQSSLGCSAAGCTSSPALKVADLQIHLHITQRARGQGAYPDECRAAMEVPGAC